MTLKELMEKTGMRLLTPEASLLREVTTGYSCDLLSWVLAHGQAGMAWITVQTHLNVVAVACLHDFACVIVPENIDVPQTTLDKAKEEGVLIYSSPKTAYALCCDLCRLGVGS